jgi:ATP-dependent protease HslVU (ClpYQ) peptidase subunit
MTTIVGIQGDGFALLATDSRISSFDEKGDVYQYTTLGAGSSKLATNGKYLVGAAGDVRAINLLHHAFHPPVCAPSLRGKRLDTFITTKFIPALTKLFDEHGYTTSEDKRSHKAEHDSTIVVAINATIYIIEGDYSWTSDTTGLYSAGTGSSYALGALQALTHKNTTPQQAKTIALKALNIAAKYDPYTGTPFHTYLQEHHKPTRK